jgi:epoxyqueuosine reductase
LDKIADYIIAYAKNHNGISGVCHADPLPDREAPFISTNREKRTNPHALLPGVKSIIVLGLGHHAPKYKNLSTLATNPDYHKRITHILRELSESMPPHRYRILVDSPYLDERALAVRAGLGFIGKHGLVITPDFGSYFNIGCILTDKAISHTTVKSCNKCPNECRLCLEACPVKLNIKKCASYLTQKKENLSQKEREWIGNQLYGCDICQTVCPYNKAKPPQDTFPPEEWLTADDTALASAYAHTAMWWRGPEIMRRNAGIALTASHNHGPAKKL